MQITKSKALLIEPSDSFGKSKRVSGFPDLPHTTSSLIQAFIESCTKHLLGTGWKSNDEEIKSLPS